MGTRQIGTGKSAAQPKLVPVFNPYFFQAETTQFVIEDSPCQCGFDDLPGSNDAHNTVSFQ